MHMYRTNSGDTFNPSGCREIGGGGEGKIYEHPFSNNHVIKIYHKARRPSYASHLTRLFTLGPEFVKPEQIYYDHLGNVAGFSMAYVDFNQHWLFNNLFNKGFCNNNGIDHNFKVLVLENMRKAIEGLHAKKVIIGDLNQYNIFVSRTGNVLFVDVDSYASDLHPHSGVLLEEIRDWTTNTLSPQSDSWSFDILAFWAITFCHPFKWVVPGNAETLEMRIRACKSFLSNIPGIRIPPIYIPPPAEAKKQFVEIFQGRRYMVNVSGKHVPVAIIPKQPLISASVSIRELYNHVTAINCAGSFIAVKNNTGWHLVDTSISKITREIRMMDSNCEQLYPSCIADKYCWIEGDKLVGSSGFYYNLRRPVLYYTDGQLVVFEYGIDKQINFNIQNQLGSLDYTTTEVFLKSIVVRGAPIQNFGAKRFLNAPNANQYMLLPLPDKTKNAYYFRTWYAAEYTERNRTKYILIGPKNQKIELDYLPFFTVKNNMVFVPADGQIDVYQDGYMISNLDVPVCTKDSSLYDSPAGILLLENNTLYLLNTK